MAISAKLHSKIIKSADFYYDGFDSELIGLFKNRRDLAVLYLQAKVTERQNLANVYLKYNDEIKSRLLL